jgi:hypothetical protein
MPRGGLGSTSFKPVFSGNPGGRRRKPKRSRRDVSFADVKALCGWAARTLEAVEQRKSMERPLFHPYDTEGTHSNNSALMQL